MTPEAAEALELSIGHWKRNVEAAEEGDLDGIEIGWRSCALCQAYGLVDNKWSCEGCPVKARTGLDGCQQTPYVQVEQALLEGNRDQVLEACRDEFAFLESLRNDA